MDVDAVRRSFEDVLDSRPSGRELAEMLWLACHLAAERPILAATPSDSTDVPHASQPASESPEASDQPPPSDASLADEGSMAPSPVPVYQAPVADRGGRLEVTPARIPDPPALGDRLNLQRSLRPLQRRVPSPRVDAFDELATAERIAQQLTRHPDQPADQSRGWAPVLRPSAERWLELAVVIDIGPSMHNWLRLAAQCAEAMAESGVFRTVHTWTMRSDADDRPEVATGGRFSLDHRQVIDPSGRRAIVVVSDCVGRMWRSGEAARALHGWAFQGPVAIMQPLPERLWRRTAAPTTPGIIRAARPGARNTELQFDPFDDFGPLQGVHARQAVLVPVIEAVPRDLRRWAKIVGEGSPQSGAVTIVTGQPRPVRDDRRSDPLNARDRVRRFRTLASPEAARLAGYLAMLEDPSIEVMRLIHMAMLARPHEPGHLSEVVLSGLVTYLAPGRYRFEHDVAELLHEQLTISEARRMEDLVTERLSAVSRLVDRQAGRTPYTIEVLAAGTGVPSAVSSATRPLAMLSSAAQRRLDLALGRRQPDEEGQWPATRPGAPDGPGASTATVPATVDQRVVTVEVIRREGIEYATGCLIGGGLVLTADVFAREGRVESGIRIRRVDGSIHVARVIARSAGLSLLSIDDPAPRFAPVRFGMLTGSAAAPRFQVHVLRPEGSGWLPAVRLYRFLNSTGDWIHLSGQDRPDNVSGAPVFCGGALTGVAIAGHDGTLSVMAVAPFLAEPEHATMLATHDVAAVASPVDLVGLLEDPGRAAATWLDLLDPGAQSVRFRGRGDELRSLRDWCRDGGVAVRVITGMGGEGKTRLALRVAAERRAAGWATGTLSDRIPATAGLDQLLLLRVPLLMIIEYAENRLPQVHDLLDALRRRHAGPAVRILLLARSAEPWLAAVRERAPHLSGRIDELGIGPLENDPAIRHEAFEEALDDFAGALARWSDDAAVDWSSAARAVAPPDLSSERLGHVSNLHLNALASLLRAGPPLVGERVLARVVDAAVQREQQYYLRTAHGREVTVAVPDELDRYVAASVLYGAETPYLAQSVIQLLGGRPPREPLAASRLAEWLHFSYPPEPGQWWGSPLPDLAAEALLTATAVLYPSMVVDVLPRVERTQAEHALRLLDRIAPPHEHLVSQLAEAIAVAPSTLAVHIATCADAPSEHQGLAMALTRVIASDNTPAETVRLLVQSVPPTRLLHVADPAAANRLLSRVRRLVADGDASTQLLAVALAATVHPHVRAGDGGVAVALAEEAITLVRRVFRANPADIRLRAELTSVINGMIGGLRDVIPPHRLQRLRRDAEDPDQ
jgi:hypothetical protein